jgi:hypothetical protein
MITESNIETTIEQPIVSEMKFTVIDNNENKIVDAPVVNEIIHNEVIENSSIVEEVKNEEEQEDNEEEYITLELTEELAFNHLAEINGMSIDEFKNSLNPKEQKKYAPEIEGFQDFYEKTGNKNFNDFLETQKDWSSETPENTLREYIRLSNPDLTKKEQDFLYNEKYSTQDLDEEDDENLITKKGIELKTDLRKAYDFFSKRKEEFNVVGGSDLHIPIEYREAKKQVDNQSQQEENYKKLIDEVKQDTIAKANQTFNSNHEGFVYEIENEDKSIDKIMYKPKDVETARIWHSDLKNLNDLFFDETGKIANVKEFHALAEIARIGVKEYTQQIAKTANANLIERQDKISKNIQPENIRAQNNNLGSSITFKVVD